MLHDMAAKAARRGTLFRRLPYRRTTRTKRFATPSQSDKQRSKYGGRLPTCEELRTTLAKARQRRETACAPVPGRSRMRQLSFERHTATPFLLQ